MKATRSDLSQDPTRQQLTTSDAVSTAIRPMQSTQLSCLHSRSNPKPAVSLRIEATLAPSAIEASLGSGSSHRVLW